MKIRTQLVLVLSGLVAGSFSAAWILASLIGTTIITNLLTEQYLVYSRLLGKMAQAAVALRAEPLFGQYMRFLQDAVPGVMYVYLESPDGTIVAHTDPAYVHKPAREWKASHSAAMALDYTSPVEMDGRAAATLRLGVVADLRPMVLDHVRTKALSPFVLSGLGGISLSVLVGVGFAFLLARPIRTLASAAREVGRGRLDVEVPVASSGELGDLARHFNEMVRRLRSLDEFKDQFITTVSHDLRNPLSAIQLGMDTLRDGLYGPLNENQSQVLTTILESAKGLNGMVENILDTAKLKAGRLFVEPKPVDVEIAIRQALELFQFTAQSRAIELELACPDSLPKAHADAQALNRILSNLIGNALKFTSERGRVSVAAKENAGWIAIEVRDTGQGIKPEDMPRLFRRFERLEEEEQKRKEIAGTGLGLVIVKHLVEAHGGTIRVESEPGHGTTFIFTLPKSA